MEVYMGGEKVFVPHCDVGNPIEVPSREEIQHDFETYISI